MQINIDEPLFSEAIHSLQQLIQIPSVKKDPLPNAPFGEPIKNALDMYLQLGTALGLHVRNLDNYIGIVEIGKGEDELGILVHVDVVPAGDVEKWDVEPFSGAIKDGSIWGRGTLDDKGPAIAVLYAMKILKDLNLQWKKRVRLIVGTDEESDWEDIEYYKRYEQPPTFGFTPDGCFPVTHSEKGILNIRYEKSYPNPSNSSIVESFVGGDRYNTTPGVATAIIKDDIQCLDNYKPTHKGITVESLNNSRYKITAYGKDGRSSEPNSEENAIHILFLELIQILQVNDSFYDVIQFYNTYLQFTDGRGHDCKLSDNVSGELTLATCVCNWDGERVSIVSDIRYPSSFKIDELVERISPTLAKSDFSWKIINHKESIYIPEQSPFIQQLLSIYNEYFNTKAKPMAISGGTYARAFPNIVAFGALIPGKPLNAHEVNEHVELEVIKDWIQIYARTIYRLAT